jgi:hypothetical protein
VATDTVKLFVDWANKEFSTKQTGWTPEQGHIGIKLKKVCGAKLYCTKE